jgi:hypothetical protein
MNSVRILGISLAVAGVWVTTAAQALQPKDVSTLQSFQLTDDYLTKYLAAQDDQVKDPCHLSPTFQMLSSTKPLDQLVAEYDAQPGVHAMLARHGLTAREEILGFVVLELAAFEMIHKEHPDMAQTTANVPMPISPANLAFYNSHKAAIHQHAIQLGQQALKANHGELPACLSTPQ